MATIGADVLKHESKGAREQSVLEISKKKKKKLARKFK